MQAEEVEKGTKINGHPRSVVLEIEEILLPPKKKFGRPKKVSSSPTKEKNPPGGPRKRNITVYFLFSLILLPSSELDNILHSIGCLKKNQYPDEDLKKLAKVLHLDKSKIIRWFCYTRHDIKRK
nr:hypothetical protein [Tanacetum cinerariifolium]